MMMSCLHGVHTMWTPMKPCHVSHMWWEWNVNPNDTMLTGFTSYANPNDVTLGMHNMHVCAH